MADPLPQVPSNTIPEDLLKDLHGANERFHKARLEMEHQMSDTDFSYHRRVDAAANIVHDAEREVEAVTDRIDKAFHGEPIGDSSRDAQTRQEKRGPDQEARNPA